jgi:tetratricopeptide (TPR) repeat protein
MMIVPSLILLLAAAPPGYQTSLDRPVALEKRVQELSKAKDWGALADFFEALPPEQSRKFSYEWLSSLDGSGRWQRMLDLSVTMGRLGPLPYLAHFKGKALSQLGRHREALDWYRDNGNKGDVRNQMMACNEALVLRDWVALQESAEGVLAKYPLDGIYLGLKGEALAKQGRFQEAEAPLNEAVHLAPRIAMNWADLACCHNEAARYPEAFEAASQALLLDPRLMEGLQNRGRACVGMKRYREGRADYAAALALKPDDEVLVRNLKANLAAMDAFLAHPQPKSAKPLAKKR